MSGNRIEQLKRQKDGLDLWPDILRYAQAGFGAIPPEDLERLKWWGLFHRAATPGLFMLRIRVPNGRLGAAGFTAAQMQAIADVAHRYGRDVVDLTTRQQIQLRWIRIEDVPDIFRRLEAVGLTTLQTGADNVRNITGCPVAGIDGGEVVNALPLVQQVTDLILGKKAYSNLPRKFNIAISGCLHNCVRAEIHDIALTPLVLPVDGRPAVGFNLRAGGRLGAHPRLASVLDVFVLPEQVPEVCVQILEIYRENGNRQTRSEGRLGDLLEDWGVERFRSELERRVGYPLLRSGVDDELGCGSDHIGVFPQREMGLSYVGLLIPGGRMTAAQLRELGRLAGEYGNGEARLTQGQNVILVNIPDERLPRLLQEPLLQVFSPEPPPVSRGFLACTGKGFCNLAQVETKERGVALARHLDAALPHLQEWRPFRIHFSGCQASCGQHPIGDIGLAGKRVEIDGQMVEAVDIYAGGRLGRNARFGRLVRESVPCDELPQVLAEMIAASEDLGHGRAEDLAVYALMPQLVTFCHVVEAGSFSAAGRRLALTQPAVSKHIQALESFFQVKLVDRSGGRCRLTPEGALVHSYARRLLLLYNDLTEAMGKVPRLRAIRPATVTLPGCNKC